MRVDLQQLFTSLNTLLLKKLELFRTILEHSARMRFSSDHGIEGEISVLLKQNAHLIEEIGALSQPIAENKRTICVLCGIGETDFSRHFASVKSGEYEKVSEYEREIEALKTKACHHYDELCRTMEKSAAETQAQIDSLSEIRKVKEMTKGNFE